MGAISFLFNRYLTFRTFKGVSTDKCDMYFKAEDCVIHMHMYASCGDNYYHQVFEIRSCNVGESCSMRASLKNISFKNNTLTVLERVIEDVFIIEKEEYDRLYEEHTNFLQLAVEEIRAKERVSENNKLAENIEKLVNNEPIVPVTDASVFTKLLQKTFNKYNHKTYDKNKYGGYSIYKIDVDKDFMVMDYPPNHKEILHTMKRYVNNIIDFSEETNNSIVIEINNILKKAK